MSHGGRRPGAGRPKGAVDRRSAAVVKAGEEAAARLTEAIPEAFRGDAHALLMVVYKDTSLPLPLRVDAAKAALRYEKPALSSVTATIHHQPSAALHDDDLARRIAQLESETAGGPEGNAAAPGASQLTH